MKKQNAFVNVADEQVSFYFILATLQNVLEQGGSLISLPPRRSTKGHELNFVCASHLFSQKQRLTITKIHVDLLSCPHLPLQRLKQ